MSQNTARPPVKKGVNILIMVRGGQGLGLGQESQSEQPFHAEKECLLIVSIFECMMGGYLLDTVMSLTMCDRVYKCLSMYGSIHL